jgi:cytochrome c oxidase assembly protein subunit 15
MMEQALPTTEDRAAIQKFARVIGFSAVLTYFLIVLGATVRANDAGLSCPDWPLCYGKLVPSFDFRIFLEWFHRVVAAGLTGVVLWSAYLLGRSRMLRKKFGVQIAAAIVLLVVQIILGGLTVLHLLEPKIVSMHLINAMFFFGILLWVPLHARRLLQPDVAVRSAKVTPAFRWAVTSLLVVLFAQLIVGGMVSTNQAGLACPDFPACFGTWVPPAGFHVWLQMSHRYLGYVVLAAALLVSFLGLRQIFSPIVRTLVRWTPTLIVVQILLGVANVVWLIPEWASVAHLANAVLLYVIVLRATADVWIARRLASYSAPQLESEVILTDATRQTLGQASHVGGVTQ